MSEEKSAITPAYKLVPAWIIWVYTLVTAVSGILAVVGAAANWYLHSVTEPVAGEVFNYVVEPNPTLPGDKGRRLVQYEVRNYGPGTLHGYKLRIILPGKFDPDAHAYAAGVSVSRVGTADWNQPVDEGQGAMLMVAAPSSADGESCLKAGGTFGIFIDAPDAQWEAKDVHLHSTSGLVSAKGPIAAPRFPFLSFHFIRDVSPWVALGMSIASAAAFPFLAWWFQHRFDKQVLKVEKDAAGRAKELAGSAYMAAERDEGIQPPSRPDEFMKAAEDAKTGGHARHDGVPPPHAAVGTNAPARPKMPPDSSIFRS